LRAQIQLLDHFRHLLSCMETRRLGTYVIESVVCDLGDDRGGILGKGGNRDYGEKMKI
jgi:hypothetical protein